MAGRRSGRAHLIVFHVVEALLGYVRELLLPRRPAGFWGGILVHLFHARPTVLPSRVVCSIVIYHLGGEKQRACWVLTIDKHAPEVAHDPGEFRRVVDAHDRDWPIVLLDGLHVCEELQHVLLLLLAHRVNHRHRVSLCGTALK
jgi:hypothetical protein